MNWGTVMRIYVIDKSEEKIRCVQQYFHGVPEVECVVEEFDVFLSSNPVQCIVSPGNSYGLMDGGYDLAITRYFGDQLQQRVQRHIIDHYYGEQPVGTSFIIDAGRNGQKLIHTPTMRTPYFIREPLVIYQCMRTTLICAMENNVESILLPLFGGGCGQVHPERIAEMMRKAYDQLQDPPKKLDWHYVERYDIVFNDM